MLLVILSIGIPILLLGITIAWDKLGWHFSFFEKYDITEYSYPVSWILIIFSIFIIGPLLPLSRVEDQKIYQQYLSEKQTIEKARNNTAHHKTHQIYYGFLSPKRVGMELAHLGIEFYKKNKRAPIHEEQILMYYGESIDPADFFIMSTKLAGLGALPPLICGQETQQYFLAAPGVMALTQDTFREILYDLIFCRPESANSEYDKNKLTDQSLLKNYYLSHRSTLIGLGNRIGKCWVPVSGKI